MALTGQNAQSLRELILKMKFPILTSTESMVNKTNTQLFQIGLTSLLYEGTYLKQLLLKCYCLGRDV